MLFRISAFLQWLIFFLTLVFWAALAWEIGFLPAHEWLPVPWFRTILILTALLELVAFILRRDWNFYRNKKSLFAFGYIVAASALLLAALFWITDEGLLRTLLHAVLAIAGIASFASRVSVLLQFRVRPQLILAASFLFLIVLGTLALMMPNATVSGISPVNALFTAVSAVCVTGLTVVDTAAHFTLLGKAIILLLIQIGGIGIITLSYLLISLVRMNISIQEKIHLQEFLSGDSRAPLVRALKTIFFFVLATELVSALMLWLAWRSDFPAIDAGVLALFHAVSAFCNAGFSLLPLGYENALARNNTPVVLVTGATIFIGSLGFLTLYDVSQYLRAKLTSRRYRLALASRVVITGSLFLVVTGMLLFWLTERNNALVNEPVGGVLLHSFFQSVTLRTAGFSTLDFGSFAPATLLFMLFYMFIGGASISTAGGVKINTVVATLLAVRMTLHADRAMNIGGRRIPFAAVNKAIVILFSATAVLAVAIFSLSLTDSRLARENLAGLVFEAFSALGTVGLSTGITPELSHAGKVILCIEMFVGRIGPLTMAMLLTRPERFTDFEYPDEDLTVG